MISLLPPEYKQNFLYAKKNSVLRKWIIVLSLSLIGCVLIIAGGYIYLDHTIKNEDKRVQAGFQALQDDDLEGTKTRLEEISSNTKLIVQVLSKEILFSKLIKQLGASLPANTTLKQIQIDGIDNGITLSAIAKDIDSAAQIQTNLADPENKIFEKADIESIVCVDPEAAQTTSGVGAENPDYPCTVQLKALFTKNNEFLYIQPEEIK